MKEKSIPGLERGVGLLIKRIHRCTEYVDAIIGEEGFDMDAFCCEFCAVGGDEYAIAVIELRQHRRKFLGLYLAHIFEHTHGRALTQARALELYDKLRWECCPICGEFFEEPDDDLVGACCDFCDYVVPHHKRAFRFFPQKPEPDMED